MPTTLRLLLLLMLGLFELQPVSYGYDAPSSFVSGAQNIVAASPETGAPTAESAASAPLNFSRGGAATDIQVDTHAFSSFVAAESVSINPAAIRFSQSSVNGVQDIVASMRANGWQGASIDVVQMSDGSLTTFDNTRVLAAQQAGIDVQAVVRGADEAFPAGRWTPKSGIQPATWQDAVQARIQQQNSLFRQTYPNGSPFTGSSQ